MFDLFTVKDDTGVSTSDEICLMEKYVSSDSANRTSHSVRLDPAETNLIATIEKRIATIAQMDVSHLEPLVVVKYDEGQYFKEHHDGKFRPVTVLIYLNAAKMVNHLFERNIDTTLDVEEGGETQFLRLGLKILPSCGSALTWRNCDDSGEADLNLLHEALPPKKGVKWAVNCFFNCKAIRVEDEQEVSS
ncbi:oxidoreductase, 2OG-Fe(II) oxygenase family protein [Cardiosporidium cionae]|uniref:Oxidoreductase, 2OG-Fe(II) oxygenase family protein n=1 Tax=Cardiosporidium cionae TaxID=476202 RepID=A0ABQ7JEK7_9APIC|nr:oxidoreductase, 2OG-Fe(II) oxygenase family protein [Cardiosporidium cionae]|eukprot:KAF8822433.1 oxidoreductase, 2OG-Fe(II) oxygenase family protein [Cardiosporidium cionae]